MRTKSIINSVFNGIGSKTIVHILAAVFIFTGCTAVSPPPPAAESHTDVFKEGVPGRIIVNTVEASAKVTGIDPASRKITLLMPDGEKTTVKVGPEAINFDQIMVNDLVKVTLTEELVIFLDKEGTSSPDGAVGIVALAPKGAAPGGVVANTKKVTGIVTAIDKVGQTVTLQFDDGSSKAFPVRDDIDLSLHKKGEKVVFLITDMIAISVEKQ